MINKTCLDQASYEITLPKKLALVIMVAHLMAERMVNKNSVGFVHVRDLHLHIWNLDNSMGMQGISLKSPPFSSFLKDLSNDTKHIFQDEFLPPNIISPAGEI